MFRPPQVRFLMTTAEPSWVLPQNAPPALLVVKSRNAPTADMVVVVEVDVEVVVVELVALAVELVVVELVALAVELVVVELVVVVGVHAGSVGAVQEQPVVVQLRRAADLSRDEPWAATGATASTSSHTLSDARR